MSGSRFVQSKPSRFIRKIASTLPLAAKAVSRFLRLTSLALLPRLTSKFMAVARPKKKSKGGKGSGSDSEAPPSFFMRNVGDAGSDDQPEDFGSMFLTPPMAPRVTPRPAAKRRRLRTLFKTRHFMKPPWMR